MSRFPLIKCTHVFLRSLILWLNSIGVKKCQIQQLSVDLYNEHGTIERRKR